MFKITVNTNKKKEVYDLTDKVNSLAQKHSANEGICTVFVKHSTAALTIADMDPGAEEDYMAAFDKLIPDLDYKHPHDPSHMPEHIMSALMSPFVSVPIRNGALDLGTWQRLVLMEFSGPRERKITVSFGKEI